MQHVYFELIAALAVARLLYAALDTSQAKLVYIIFKNLVRTSKKAQYLTITKINWLMLFKEIIAVYTENHMKHVSTKCSVTYR
jgi:hypothetical protein